MPDIEGVPYEASGGKLDQATAQALAARHREAASAGVGAVSAAIAPVQSQVSALSSRVDSQDAKTLTDAKAYTDTKVTGLATTAAMQAGDQKALADAKAYTDEQVAGLDLGSGSGVGSRLVSGGVEFSAEDESLPPFVVATTTGATVEGVTLTAGQMAAFWYLNGAWHVMVHGQDAAWRSTAKPDTRIAVTPTGPTFTNATSGSGGTWTTPAQTGITYSPASGTATAGQTVTVAATLSDPAVYKFAAGAKTSWTYSFPDPSKPVADTFVGAAGPLAGHTTTTGGLTWEGSTNGWNLTGDGKVVPSNTAALCVSTLPTVTNTADVSIEYSERSGRFQIGFGDHHNVAMGIAANGEVMCFAGGVNITSPAVWKTAPSGTLRFRYDGNTVTFWHDGVQVATKTGFTSGARPLQIRNHTDGGSTKLSNLTLTPVAKA